MRIRLAEVADAEAIRTIYNVEVLESTNTFDMVPRTRAEQEAWILEPQRGPSGRGGDRAPGAGGAGPGRGQRRDRPRLRLALPLPRALRATRPRPRTRSTSTGPSGARAWAGPCWPSCWSWPRPTASTRSSPASPATTRPPSGCTGRRLRAGRGRARGRAQAPPVARRGRAPAAALGRRPGRPRGPAQDSSAAPVAGSPGSRERSIRHEVVQLPERDDGHGPEHQDGQHHAGRVGVHQLVRAGRRPPGRPMKGATVERPSTA